MKLLLAGGLTSLAGATGNGPHAWVVVAVGLMMIAAGLYRDQMILAAQRRRRAIRTPMAGPTGRHEVITRERIRERRERWL